MSDADLAALDARGLVRFGPDDGAGLPRTIDATEYGKAFLKRYCLANNLKIVFTKPEE